MAVLVSAGLVVLPQLPPAVPPGPARVVMAARGYRPAREPDDVAGVIRMSVPGTLFEDVAVSLLPGAFALHRDAMLCDPASKIELRVIPEPDASPLLRGLIRLRVCHSLQLLPA